MNKIKGVLMSMGDKGPLNLSYFLKLGQQGGTPSITVHPQGDVRDPNGTTCTFSFSFTLEGVTAVSEDTDMDAIRKTCAKGKLAYWEFEELDKFEIKSPNSLKIMLIGQTDEAVAQIQMSATLPDGKVNNSAGLHVTHQDKVLEVLGVKR